VIPSIKTFGLGRASEDPTIFIASLQIKNISGFQSAHRRTRYLGTGTSHRILKQDPHWYESTSAVVPSDNQVPSNVLVQAWSGLDHLKPNATGEIAHMRSNSIQMNQSLRGEAE